MGLDRHRTPGEPLKENPSSDEGYPPVCPGARLHATGETRERRNNRLCGFRVRYPMIFLFIQPKTHATARNKPPTHVGQACCSG